MDGAQEQFSQGVGNVLMAVEELKLSILSSSPQQQKEASAPPLLLSIDSVLHWRDAIEYILQLLEQLARLSDDAVADLEQDLFHHCELKTVQVVQLAFDTAMTLREPFEEDGADLPAPIDVIRQDGQASIARLAEVNLLLLQNAKERGTKLPETTKTADDVVASYVAFQRQTLRLRAKPAIAELVQARRDGLNVKRSSLVVRHEKDVYDDDEDEDDDDVPSEQHFHAPVLATILGQAAALIHPLLSWQVHFPPDVDTGIVGHLRKLCQESIETLDDQAQTLTKTVSEWFFEDRPIEAWMQKSASEMKIEGLDLKILDCLVEEMAFGCLVQFQYQSLVESKGAIADVLLPEWTWKYATLERFLVMQQWQTALIVAKPDSIVIGTDIQVPSVVEHAQLLSTRALERAASTRNRQAIGTVAHAVSHDVWSNDISGGVYQALMERRGCWSEPEEKRVESPPKSSGFASALLDALDEDLKAAPPSSALKKPPSAPNSGGFLTNIVVGGDKMEQIQLDTELCALNGIHAACGACRSLVQILDALLSEENEDLPQDERATPMIQLAREELFRFAGSYERLLDDQLNDVVAAFCGSIDDFSSGGHWTSRGLAFHSLRVFFEHETYNLDGQGMIQAEADERLERDMLEPLRNSRFLSKLTEKCEHDVLQRVGRQLVSVLVDLILEVLWKEDKKFSEWGSLLLAKQVRLLQGFVAEILTAEGDVAPNLLEHWEKLSQVVTVLQLEKPGDWLMYDSILSLDELVSTFQLRVDWSSDVIQTVASQVKAKRGEDQ